VWDRPPPPAPALSTTYDVCAFGDALAFDWPTWANDDGLNHFQMLAGLLAIAPGEVLDEPPACFFELIGNR